MALASTLLLVAFAWADPLPNDNDALYADVIRAVREGGHLIALQVNGIPFLDKPPLFFWAGALVTKFFGESTFVLRLPAICAGVLGAVLVARIARSVTDLRESGG